MNLDTKQKRFLIIWIIFHSFALFVNLAKIQGTIKEESSLFTPEAKYEYLFTSLTDWDKFWPITTYYEKVHKYPTPTTSAYDVIYFNGIFNSYDYREYIFYILIGIGIVFVPKIWK